MPMAAPVSAPDSDAVIALVAPAAAPTALKMRLAICRCSVRSDSQDGHGQTRFPLPGR